LKFTNGYWLYRGNVTCHGATTAIETAIERNRVIMYISPTKIHLADPY